MRRDASKFQEGYYLGMAAKKLEYDKEQKDIYLKDFLEMCETANERLSLINGFNHGYDEYTGEE